MFVAIVQSLELVTIGIYGTVSTVKIVAKIAQSYIYMKHMGILKRVSTTSNCICMPDCFIRVSQLAQ